MSGKLALSSERDRGLAKSIAGEIVSYDGGMEFAQDDPGVIEAELARMADVAGSLMDLGRWEEADRLASLAQARAKELLGADSMPEAEALQTLGVLSERQHFPKVALERVNRVLDIYGQHLDSQDARITGALGNRGIAHLKAEEYDLAEKDLRAAIERHEHELKAAPEADRAELLQGLSMCLNNLGLVFTKLERLDETLGAHERSYELSRLPGAYDPRATNVMLGNLGRLHFQRGDFEKGRPFVEEPHAGLLEFQEPDSPELHLAYEALMKLERTSLNFEKAAFNGEALVLSGDRSFGSTDEPAFTSRVQLAEVHYQLGNWLEAAGRWKEALAIAD